MWRVVCRPEWLRAPVRGFFVVKEASGPPLCRCERSILTTKRVPGEVGFILMSAMAYESLTNRAAGEVDGLPGLQTYVRFLVAVALAGDILETAGLARLVEQVDAFDLDFEHQFDGLFDLGLRRIVPYAEHVLVRLLADGGGLFRHLRLDQHGHQAFFIHSRLRDAVRAASRRRPWQSPCRA